MTQSEIFSQFEAEVDYMRANWPPLVELRLARKRGEISEKDFREENARLVKAIIVGCGISAAFQP
jgi:hypothetical protein